MYNMSRTIAINIDDQGVYLSCLNKSSTMDGVNYLGYTPYIFYTLNITNNLLYGCNSPYGGFGGVLCVI